MDYQHALWSSVDSVNYLLTTLNRFHNQLSQQELDTLKEIEAENEEYSEYLQENGDD